MSTMVAKSSGFLRILGSVEKKFNEYNCGKVFWLPENSWFCEKKVYEYNCGKVFWLPENSWLCE
jgi:hypothetical protein